MLIIQDMNLDPDGRDNFTVEHITKSSKSTIMNAQSCKEGTQVFVRGGKLVIHFKPFKTSKSGRGFILIFRSKSFHGFWGLNNFINLSICMLQILAFTHLQAVFTMYCFIRKSYVVHMYNVLDKQQNHLRSVLLIGWQAIIIRCSVSFKPFFAHSK